MYKVGSYVVMQGKDDFKNILSQIHVHYTTLYHYIAMLCRKNSWTENL